MSSEIILYSKDYCRYCVRAKRLLEGKGLAFTEINLEGQLDEISKLMAKTNMRTLPQIFVGEQFIGGYQELAAMDQSGELDQLFKS